MGAMKLNLTIQTTINGTMVYDPPEPVSPLNNVQIAKETSGFSGADLANLVNESAIIALNNDKNIVNMSDFKEAIDKIIFEKKC